MSKLFFFGTNLSSNGCLTTTSCKKPKQIVYTAYTFTPQNFSLTRNLVSENKQILRDLDKHLAIKMFTRALFIKNKILKQHKCIIIRNRLNKLWDVHRMEYSTASKNNTLDQCHLEWLRGLLPVPKYNLFVLFVTLFFFPRSSFLMSILIEISLYAFGNLGLYLLSLFHFIKVSVHDK